MWKFERSPDPNKHFVLKSVTPLGADATRTEIANRLSKASDKSMLVFVHGYNNGFEDAAMALRSSLTTCSFPAPVLLQLALGQSRPRLPPGRRDGALE